MQRKIYERNVIKKSRTLNLLKCLDSNQAKSNLFLKNIVCTIKSCGGGNQICRLFLQRLKTAYGLKTAKLYGKDCAFKNSKFRQKKSKKHRYLWRITYF